MQICTVELGVPKSILIDLYSDPYISRVGHDHRPAKPIEHDLVFYLAAKIDGVYVGAFLCVLQTKVDCHIHSLLKKSALKKSRILCRKAIRWVFENMPVSRVSSPVIEGFEKAMNLCKKIGMNYEGCLKDACVVEGVLKDIHLMGITRRGFES